VSANDEAQLFAIYQHLNVAQLKRQMGQIIKQLWVNANRAYDTLYAGINGGGVFVATLRTL
jgi:hypothetical protein